MRHYLGRLASWAKSARFVVEMASSHDLLAPCVEVKRVSCPRHAISPIELAVEEPLESLIASLTRAGVKEAREQCKSKWRPLLEIYEERWGSIRRGAPVHAEMTILDHFHHQGLQFAYGKAYIGCSKPSCFCCRVYMSNHPLRPIERPSHNNVWVRWSPPSLTQQIDGEMSVFSDGVMNALSKLIKQKIQEELSQGIYGPRQRMFDSMTDLSASLPTAFDSMVVRSN